LGKQFSAWLCQRDVGHTTTGGEEHQGCARAEGESMFLKEEHVCLWILPKLKPIFARWRYVVLQNIGFENNWRLLVFDCLG